jgi:transposase
MSGIGFLRGTSRGSCWTPVDELDVSSFYDVYQRDGMGRRHMTPRLMVALFLNAYACRIRSARKIERACEEDVAFRVIAMLQKPDHATVARFAERHLEALGELFGSVLALCAKAGLAQAGLVANRRDEDRGKRQPALRDRL